MCSQLLSCQLSCLHAGHCSRSCSQENTAKEDGHRRYNCTSPAQAFQDQQGGPDIVVTAGSHDDCHGHWRWCAHTCTDRSGSLGCSCQSPSCHSLFLACPRSCKLLCTFAHKQYIWFLCFPAHDELGTCMTAVVSSEQPVLCIPLTASFPMQTSPHTLHDRIPTGQPNISCPQLFLEYQT